MVLHTKISRVDSQGRNAADGSLHHIFAMILCTKVSTPERMAVARKTHHGTFRYVHVFVHVVLHQAMRKTYAKSE